ncbi:MAG: 2,3,4,5-tetrahydropyridine-2,6-dicarboxylate N-succinyltransferase, partial [Jatrophihabitantaceae bacterium]
MNNSAETSIAHGTGLATVTDEGTVLDVYYPAPALGAPATGAVPAGLAELAGADPARGERT